MTTLPLIYATGVYANLTEPDAVLGVALVGTSGAWRYIETVDVEAHRLDEFARERFVPRMKKLPFGKFVRSNTLTSCLREAADSMGWTIDQPLHTLGPLEALRDARLNNLLQQSLGESGANRSLSITEVQVDSEVFNEFIERSGGERVRHHPLVRAIGAALCDPGRTVPTNFQSLTLHHFELLMGSKNALSFRAWVRNQERRWASEHAPASIAAVGA